MTYLASDMHGSDPFAEELKYSCEAANTRATDFAYGSLNDCGPIIFLTLLLHSIILPANEMFSAFPEHSNECNTI